MNEFYELELIDGIGVFRPTGSYRFQQAVALVTDIIVQARDSGLRQLLLNSHNLAGFTAQFK